MVDLYNLEEFNVSYSSLCYLSEQLDLGRVIACPAANGYILMCSSVGKNSIKKVQKYFAKEKRLPVVLYKDVATLASEIALNQSVFKLIKKNSPSPCTFVLKIQPALAAKIVYERRVEVGVRLPDESLIAQIIDYSSSKHIVAFGAFDSGSQEFSVFADELAEKMHHLDMIVIDYDRPVKVSPSTILDCTTWPYSVIREGDFIVS